MMSMTQKPYEMGWGPNATDLSPMAAIAPTLVRPPLNLSEIEERAQAAGGKILQDVRALLTRIGDLQDQRDAVYAAVEEMEKHQDCLYELLDEARGL